MRFVLSFYRSQMDEYELRYDHFCLMANFGTFAPYFDLVQYTYFFDTFGLESPTRPQDLRSLWTRGALKLNRKGHVLYIQYAGVYSKESQHIQICYLQK